MGELSQWPAAPIGPVSFSSSFGVDDRYLCDLVLSCDSRPDMSITIQADMNHHLVSDNCTLTFSTLCSATHGLNLIHAYHLLSCSLCPVDGYAHH